MLTVNLKTGQKLIFMDFYPCKAKDLPKKMADLITKINMYRGVDHERTNKNKSNVL